MGMSSAAVYDHIYHVQAQRGGRDYPNAATIVVSGHNKRWLINNNFISRD